MKAHKWRRKIDNDLLITNAARLWRAVFIRGVAAILYFQTHRLTVLFLYFQHGFRF